MLKKLTAKQLSEMGYIVPARYLNRPVDFRPKLRLKWYPDLNVYMLIDKSTGRYIGSADLKGNTVIVSQAIKTYFKSLS